MTSLELYAANNPMDVPPVEHEPGIDWHEQQAKAERIHKLKDILLSQLEQGADCRDILNTAVLAIGETDPEFKAKAEPFLIGVEPELFTDIDEIRAKTAERRARYIEKRRAELNRQLSLVESDKRELLAELNKLPKED